MADETKVDHISKKRSCEVSLESENEKSDSKRQKNNTLHDFKLVKILAEDAKIKTQILHLKHKTDLKDAVCILEKSPFPNNKVETLLSSEVVMELQFNNDVYSQFLCIFPEEINFVKNTLIYPANEKHLNKYSSHKTYLVTESPQIYKDVTLPFIQEQIVHLQWVHNILEKKAESDRILFENPHCDEGFILLPDLKWEQTQLKNLYVVALCNTRTIRSIRDLNASHLPLLKNILKEGTEAIVKKYDVCGRQLRVFVHYQPTYYHFHVHFTHVEYDAPGSVIARAHLLQDIIENIEMFDNDYYAKRTLQYIISEKNKLFSCLKTSGIITQLTNDED